MLILSQLSPRLEHIVTDIFTVPANLLNLESILLLPQVSTKLAKCLLHLCDTWWVWNCRMPILLQCTCSQHFSVWMWEMLSTLRWMWNIQAFWGLFAVGVVFQEGLKKRCFWYSLCYVTQGKDANVSTCYILPQAPEFSISYWLNVYTYAVSTAAKCVRIYVRKNETNRTDFCSDLIINPEGSWRKEKDFTEHAKVGLVLGPW